MALVVTVASLWLGGSALLAAVSPAGVVREFSIPAAESGPEGIAAGPDGNVWFAEEDTSEIGRITPSGVVTQFLVHATGSAPLGITAGSDGNLWFTEQNDFVGRITPGGAITQVRVPGSTRVGTAGITAGPDGDIWFTETDADAIGRITASGQVTQFPLPSGSEPLAITTGPDGDLWFTAPGRNAIGRITPDGAVATYTIPTAKSNPFSIAAGPDGNLWFTENAVGRIGRITPTGQISEFSVPTTASGPIGIAAGSDGDVWFTEGYAGKIGRITPAGQITEFAVPGPQSRPTFITTGPDGDLWFTDQLDGGKVGLISSGAGPLAGSAPPPTLAATAAATPLAGEVFVRRPRAHRFTLLARSSAIPFGSTIDVSAGTVTLTTATRKRRTQTARFFGGRFLLTQKRSGQTELRLNAPLSCRARTAASRARGSSGRTTRHLWGDGHGSFTTIGRYASATVLGTRWLIEDTCQATRVTVTTGEVRLYELMRRRSLVLRAPRTYTVGN